MCAFCAAIPVAGALGAKARSKQIEQEQLAKAEGRVLKKPIPIGRLTAVAIAGLLAGSVFYHTHIGALL